MPEPSPVQIERVTAAHAGALAALHTLCFEGQPWHRAWDAAEMIQVLALPGAIGWLALGRDADSGENGEVGDVPVGLLLVQGAGPDADILTLGILPGPWRRRGVARALLRHGEHALAAVGTERVILEVAIDNGGAIAFYERAGYETVGRRPGYYSVGRAGRIDATLMARKLKTSTNAEDAIRPESGVCHPAVL